jgi:hypothetical protein
LTLKIRIINAAAPDILDSLTLTVNGHPVPLETVLKQGTLAVICGSIPKSLLTADSPHPQAFTRLAFSVNRTAPLTLDGSDHRLVGLAFHRLQIVPDAAEAIDDEDFAHYNFPADDANWVQVADFVGTYLHRDEKLVSPGEFSKRFPKQFRSQNIPFSDKPSLNWVVIHRGMLQAMDLPSLKWAIAHMHPVFSNDVFIVLSNRDDVPHQSRLSRDWLLLQLQTFLLDLEDHKLLPSRLRNSIFQVSKAIYKRSKGMVNE